MKKLLIKLIILSAFFISCEQDTINSEGKPVLTRLEVQVLYPDFEINPEKNGYYYNVKKVDLNGDKLTLYVLFGGDSDNPPYELIFYETDSNPPKVELFLYLSTSPHMQLHEKEFKFNLKPIKNEYKSQVNQIEMSLVHWDDPIIYIF